LLRRGGAVLAAAFGALLVFSFVSGLGLGWVTALSGAGASKSWTSPATAVGMAVDAVAKGLGGDLDAVPVARIAALLLLPLVLAAILWHTRSRDPMYGAAAACLALIFLAPITQPWYLFWPLMLFAVSAAIPRWLPGAIVASMFLILPDGDGAWKPLQVPLAFLMTGLAGLVAYRAVRWLRDPRPDEAVECRANAS
jgi:alpha-1,6-mannosyltransferase